MALLALVAAIVLIVVGIRGTHGTLLPALRADVPAFVVWGAAIVGVAAIGFVPGLKPVSRGLLALVIIAIVLANYENIIGSFEGTALAPATGGGSPGPVSTGGGGASTANSLMTLIANLAGSNEDYGESDGYSSAYTGGDTPTLNAITATQALVSDSQTGADAGRQIQAQQKQGSAASITESAMPVTSPIAANSNAAWDAAMAIAHASQYDYSMSYEQDIQNRVVSGNLVKGSEEYNSQLAYMANLRGGVATYDAEMARLKAAGF